MKNEEGVLVGLVQRLKSVRILIVGTNDRLCPVTTNDQRPQMSTQLHK
ncbi:MAG: hypothetical protein IJS82_04175 [Paludibacteraceae bacterium]|nr:hypothetical protein [Paludibacteraceae bacterium]